VINALQLQKGYDRGLTIAGTSTVVFQDAWELFKKYTQVSFVDAVIGAMAKRIGAKHICSFDDDFDALPFVERIH
jgi:predicted nucleic acid-binding protein